MRATDFTNEEHQSDINFDKAYDSFVGAEMTGVDAGKDGSGHYIRTHGANKKTDPEYAKKIQSGSKVISMKNLDDRII